MPDRSAMAGASRLPGPLDAAGRNAATRCVADVSSRGSRHADACVRTGLRYLLFRDTLSLGAAVPMRAFVGSGCDGRRRRIGKPPGFQRVNDPLAGPGTASQHGSGAAPPVSQRWRVRKERVEYTRGCVGGLVFSLLFFLFNMERKEGRDRLGNVRCLTRILHSLSGMSSLGGGGGRLIWQQTHSACHDRH